WPHFVRVVGITLDSGNLTEPSLGRLVPLNSEAALDVVEAERAEACAPRITLRPRDERTGAVSAPRILRHSAFSIFLTVSAGVVAGFGGGMATDSSESLWFASNPSKR
ncbi:hypothetical protein B296_00022534, partial [Ensete ventricosum]